MAPVTVTDARKDQSRYDPDWYFLRFSPKFSNIFKFNFKHGVTTQL